MKKLLACALLSLTASVNATPMLNAANGHYYDSISASTSWEAAKVAAESMSYNGVTAHLATITSADEDAWIYSNIAGDGYLLGATDKASEGIWEWVTGESFAYSNWHVGEPNNVGGVENYLIYQFSDGTWNDLPDSHDVIRGYIVEYDFPQSAQSISLKTLQADVPAPPIASLLIPGLLAIFGRTRKSSKS